MPAMRNKSISIPSCMYAASSIDRKWGSPWLLSCPHVFFKSSTRSVHSIHFPSTFHPLQSIHFPLQACHHHDSDPCQLRLPNALNIFDILPSPPLQGSPGRFIFWSESNRITLLLENFQCSPLLQDPYPAWQGALWTPLGLAPAWLWLILEPS